MNLDLDAEAGKVDSLWVFCVSVGFVAKTGPEVLAPQKSEWPLSWGMTEAGPRGSGLLESLGSETVGKTVAKSFVFWLEGTWVFSPETGGGAGARGR